MHKMQAVILAAGNSSRLYPYTTEKHKSEIVICGKMLIEHTLDSLAKVGIIDVVIITSATSKLQEKLGDGSRYRISLSYVVQEEALGMGNALLAAKDRLDTEFLLLSGYHVNAGEFVHDLQGKNQENNLVLLAKKSETTEQYGNILLEDDRVVSIKEKPTPEEQTNLRLVSMYLLNKDFLSFLSQTELHDHQFEHALDVYTKEKTVRCVVTEKETVSLKYPWDLLTVKDYLLSQITEKYIAPTASIAENVVITGNVVIEENVKIYEGVVIKGSCYIGKNTVIGNNAVLRNEVCVESDCLIGSGMEIKNALFMQGATTHSGFIGDSVVGEYTKIAAAMDTANVRLDRQSVKSIIKNEKVDTHCKYLGVFIGSRSNLGIRITTMPGIIVGNNVIIGPSTTVMKNIPDNKKYYTKFAEVIEENNE